MTHRRCGNLESFIYRSLLTLPFIGIAFSFSRSFCFRFAFRFRFRALSLFILLFFQYLSLFISRFLTHSRPFPIIYPPLSLSLVVPQVWDFESFVLPIIPYDFFGRLAGSHTDPNAELHRNNPRVGVAENLIMPRQQTELLDRHFGVIGHAVGDAILAELQGAVDVEEQFDANEFAASLRTRFGVSMDAGPIAVWVSDAWQRKLTLGDNPAVMVSVDVPRSIAGAEKYLDILMQSQT